MDYSLNENIVSIYETFSGNSILTLYESMITNGGNLKGDIVLTRLNTDNITTKKKGVLYSGAFNDIKDTREKPPAQHKSHLVGVYLLKLTCK